MWAATVVKGQISADPGAGFRHGFVGAENRVAGHDRVRLAFRHFAAEIEDDQPIDHRQQRMHDMLDPDDGDTAIADAGDRLDQRMALVFDQSAGDFVEQQQFRPGRQRPRHFKPLSIQQPQASCRVIGLGYQARAFENAAAAAGRRLFGLAATKDCPNQQVFVDAHTDEGTRDLKRSGDAEPTALGRWERYDILSQEGDFSGIGFEIAGDEAKQAGLAGAVRPDNADGIPGCDVQVQRVRNLECSEALASASRSGIPSRMFLPNDATDARKIAGPWSLQCIERLQV